MSILVVGGDSVGAITERAYAGGHGCVEHWSGRKSRDLTRSIPKDTEAVVLLLDRVNHTLARKVRCAGASRRRRARCGYRGAVVGERSAATGEDRPRNP